MEDGQEPSQVHTIASDHWVKPLVVNGTILTLKLDTGAKVNLINMRDVHELKHKPVIMQKAVALKAYNGHAIETKVLCRLTVKRKTRSHTLMFVIVPEGHDSLLGNTACESLRLVKRVYTIND
jgi:hypothetical protein